VNNYLRSLSHWFPLIVVSRPADTNHFFENVESQIVTSHDHQIIIRPAEPLHFLSIINRQSAVNQPSSASKQRTEQPKEVGHTEYNII
jgi:hypothetical protein